MSFTITFRHSVYRSADRGATWITATAGLTRLMYIQGRLAVNPARPTVLFAGDQTNRIIEGTEGR